MLNIERCHVLPFLSTLGETCVVPNDDTLAGKAEDRALDHSKKAGNLLQRG